MTGKTSRKTDRRIEKTKTAIKTAFQELLIETDYDKITITALARKADIDRKTFYAHYASIEDVVDDHARETVQGIITNIDGKGFFGDLETNVNLLFMNLNSLIEENLSFRQRILQDFTIEKIAEHWSKAVKEILITDQISFPDEAGQYLDYFLDFYLAGTIAVYRTWLESDRQIPLETIAAIASRSAVEGLRGLANMRR